MFFTNAIILFRLFGSEDVDLDPNSPERQSSPNDFQQMLQQPTMDNLDSLLTNVFAAQTQTQPNLNMSAYQIENNLPYSEHSNDTNIPPLVPPPALPPILNINDLFQKLVATGIVSTIPEQHQAPLLQQSAPKEDFIFEPPPQQQLLPHQLSSNSRPRKQKEPEVFVMKNVDLRKPTTLKLRQPALLQSLYSGMQCSSCGMRFLPESSIQYSQHLDWHFRQNRKGKKNIRKATSRRWYYGMTDWNNYEEIEDLEEREKRYFENQQKDHAEGGVEDSEEQIEIPSVAADKAATLGISNFKADVPDPRCEVCQEQFEQFYNEDKEEWHLRMAVRVDGATYHPLCYEDFQVDTFILLF